MIDEEDEGVYDESPDSSQLMELLPNGCPISQAIVDEQCITSHELRSRYMAPGVPIISRPVYSCGASTGTMSFARTSCFLFSIAVCVGYVASVLWLIPCQFSPCRLSKTAGNLSRDWLHQYPFIRITADPQTVVIGSGKETVIILAYKTVSNYKIAEIYQIKPAPFLYGVMALQEKDGKELWKQPFYTDIIDVICNSVDVNADGLSDCLITGNAGLVAAMSASTGQIIWYLHNHDDHSVSFLALSSAQPLPNTDFDADGVEDLVVIALFNYEMHNFSLNLGHSDDYRLGRKVNSSRSQSPHILFVSGSSGQTIGHSLSLPFIHNRLGSIPHNDTIILPNPVLLSFDNGSLGLLLSSNAEANGFHKSGAKMGANVYLLQIDDLYEVAIANCSKESTADGIKDGCSLEGFHMKEIYSGENNVMSIYPVQHSLCKADVLIYASGAKIILLNGCNDLKPSWSFTRRGHVLSKPVFGFYDNDEIPDVFFMATPTNCSDENCNLQAIICNGKDGHILNEIVTPCNVFSPIITKGHPFLFKTPVLTRTTDASELEKNTLPILVNQVASMRTGEIISSSQTLEYIAMPTSKNLNASMSDVAGGIQKMLLKLSEFGHKEQAIGNFNLSSRETVMCHSDPEKFHATVLESVSHRQLLISVQNKERASEVSRIDISALFP